ncbi:hypothetical protein chiPu_0026786, partial [Chiloscyllium punctatum]|nr:hypothetical protein [Chiloscyllium punctatum]
KARASRYLKLSGARGSWHLTFVGRKKLLLFEVYRQQEAPVFEDIVRKRPPVFESFGRKRLLVSEVYREHEAPVIRSYKVQGAPGICRLYGARQFRYL